MSTSTQIVRLAGEELRDHRHVCAIVDGPEEADLVLLPFLTDGLEDGDRVFRVGEGRNRESPER